MFFLSAYCDIGLYASLSCRLFKGTDSVASFSVCTESSFITQESAVSALVSASVSAIPILLVSADTRYRVLVSV